MDEHAFSSVPRHLVQSVIDLRKAVDTETEVSPALYAHLEDAERELIDAAIDDINKRAN